MNLLLPKRKSPDLHRTGIKRVLQMVRCFCTGVIFILFSCLVLVAAAPCCFAGAGDLFRLTPETPWHVEADSIVYDKQAGVYAASGNVVITKEGKKITADNIRLDPAGQMLYASGNVVMTAGDDMLTGRHFVMDMDANTGTVYDGTLFISEKHFFISGDTIKKTGDDTYTADRFSLSSCDPDDPDWKITGQDLDLTVEGYGSLHDAALWAGKIPVFYTPYLFFPVKIKRQTGFLPPRLSYSDRKGFQWEQPFYWAISDSSDMTFYSHYMSQRGEKAGLEYRQIFDNESKITVQYDFLNDRKTNNAFGDDYGYEHDSWLRQNSDRYWLRIKQDQSLPGGCTAKLDIDFVSDQDYLIEFEDGYTGFDASDRYFEKNFGRDLDENTNPIRTNSFNIQKTWSQNSLSATFRWNDDVIKRRQDLEDDTVQRLPVVRFKATKQKIADTPLYYELGSEYLYGFTEDSLRGHRADVHPKISLPGRFENFFTFEPSLGFRETFWHIDRYATDTGEKRSLSRGIYDAGLRLSSELYRVFSLDANSGEKLQHSIIPTVKYDYVPRKDQDSYPKFDDSIDIIEAQNKITYSITNIFTLKSFEDLPGNSTDTSQDGQRAGIVKKPVYREVCRLKVSQSYDINEARGDSPEDWKNKKSREPFSPVFIELDARPLPSLKLRAKAHWDQYSDKWTDYDTEVSFSNERGDRFSGGYRYNRNVSESIYGIGTLVLNDDLSLYGQYERNIMEGTDIKKEIGMVYRASCWSVDLSYMSEPDDRTYLIKVNLYGLGEIGTDISAGDIKSTW